MPALVSTMSICIVFVPLVFLTEPSHSLFVPLGMAVVLAMMASYGLSRTLIPLMCKYLLAHEHEHSSTAASAPKNAVMAFFLQIHRIIDSAFDNARDFYHGLLNTALKAPLVTVALFLGFYALSFCLLPFIGMEYFPIIDGGGFKNPFQPVIQVHRIEETRATL